jgi:hypothetical protein
MKSSRWNDGTNLPFLHLVLLLLVLLDELIEHLLQAIGVRLQCRDDILDGPLDEDAIDHPEALAVLGQRLQCLEDQPSERAVSRGIGR